MKIVKITMLIVLAIALISVLLKRKKDKELTAYLKESRLKAETEKRKMVARNQKILDEIRGH